LLLRKKNVQILNTFDSLTPNRSISWTPLQITAGLTVNANIYHLISLFIEIKILLGQRNTTFNIKTKLSFLLNGTDSQTWSADTV
jgi:hypothetical protein